ncbi:1,25-dihydroxyvitamin D(3) 24-hydroxylase, mitochondrial-like [Glandiceps talaboti]
MCAMLRFIHGFHNQTMCRRMLNPAIRSTSTIGHHVDIPQTNEAIKSFDELPMQKHSILETMSLPLKALGVALGIRKLDTKPWITLSEARQKYGSLWKQKFGTLSRVSICDPKDVQTVFRNEGEFPNRLPPPPWVLYRKLSGKTKGVLLSTGKDWHRQRTVLNKRILRPREIASYDGTVNDVITDYIHKILRVRQVNNVVPDIEKLTFTWTLESVCAVILDKKLKMLASDEPQPEAQTFIQAVNDMFDSTTWACYFTELQAKWNTRTWKTQRQSWDTLFSTVNRWADECMDRIKETMAEEGRNEHEASNMIEYMVSRGTMSPGEIVSSITELMTAATHTTSTAVQWNLYNLAKHQHIQQSLYEEVSRVVPQGELPSAKHINEMRYLRAVVKETLRLYPSSFNSTRVLDKDIILKGYHIPAKTTLTLQTWLIARDPEYFKDPHEFKPERWLQRRKRQHNPEENFHVFLSLPFGFGTRMCIGRRIAELELHLVLARIIQRFSLETTTDVEPVLRIIVHPDRPLNLKFITRDEL